LPLAIRIGLIYFTSSKVAKERKATNVTKAAAGVYARKNLANVRAAPLAGSTVQK